MTPVWNLPRVIAKEHATWACSLQLVWVGGGACACSVGYDVCMTFVALEHTCCQLLHMYHTGQ